MTEENHKESIWRRFKSLFGGKQQETVRETIEDLIEEANSEGDCPFSEHEQLLLNNILYLKDKKCCHAMIPRANIIAFHKDGTVRELAELMVTRGHSRIPIYGDSLDDILGIIHIIDLAKCLLKGEGDVKVEDVVNREVKFVSPSMRVLDLLRDMQANKIHMAMVIDEYGGVNGIVTVTDLVEKLVGDFSEILPDEMSEKIEKTGENEWCASGIVPLTEAAQALKIDLPTDKFDTVGGYLMSFSGSADSR